MMKAALLLVTVVGCTEGDDPPQNTPPPWGVPISGGNLHITRDGAAVIADPDRDRILMVDLATQGILGEVSVPGEEPGRIIEDGEGRVHVALRRGGSLVTFTNGRSPQILHRRAICGEPRGLTWQAAGDLVHVACAGGELVSLPASGGDAVRTLRLERDLRDVVVSGANLVVTRFRTAELMTIDAAGAIVTRTQPPTVQRVGFRDPFNSNGFADAVPTVAWRTISLPNNRLLVSHQRQVMGELRAEEGGYGGGCGGETGPVESAITLVEPGVPPIPVVPFARGALPVDIAVSPNGAMIAVATAGNNLVHTASIGTINSRDMDPCPRGPGGPGGEGDDLGTPTSIAFTANNDLVIFYPEAPALVVRKSGTGASVAMTLPGGVGYDAGRGLFHAQTAIGMACAGCHPEGRDDGRVWTFSGMGVRRTQSLAGSILQRGPYHWVGDMTDLNVLMDDVFANRMSGGEVTRTQRAMLGPWLDRVPAPKAVPAADLGAVERGRQAFEAAQCGSCHGGQLYTNNLLVDVGTGGKFKVPSLLGIADRAPFMHTGCAKTLRERFAGGCGGGDLHGVTSSMSSGQIDDLVAYLETL